jgi:hypothetical protein
MDCGTISDTALGLVNYPVRIREIEEQDDGSFQITAEEFPGTLGQASGQTTQGGQRAFNNQQVAVASVNPPIIFEPNSLAAARLNSGSTAPILCILASGGSAGVNDPNWGGAIVNVSSDGGTTYGPIGTISEVANQGTLTASLASYSAANPDTVDTLAVNLAESAGTLTSTSTAADAAAGVTLGIVQDGVGSTSYELLDPQTATLTGANAYNLTNLYRGLFGTTGGAHSSGALYGRLDAALFIFPLPAAYIGVALKIKLQSFNVFGNALQDLSTCTVYTYTPNGQGSGGGAGGVPTSAIRQVVCSENLAAGAFVNIFSNAGAINVRNANATDDSRPADGFVAAAFTAGQSALVLGLGQQYTAVAIAGGGSMTPGLAYFLSTTNGQVTPTAPSSAGNYQQLLGKADTATALTFVPQTTGMGA